jgi:cytochrome c-type biogenesis protein CcmH
MLLGAALVSMAVAVVAVILMPLMRTTRPPPAPGALYCAVYRAQLQELERDVARGLIDEGEVAAARLEIERRLLAADAGSEGEAAPSRDTSSPRLAVALALAVPTAASLLYLALGAPDVPGRVYAAAGDERPPAATTAGHADFAGAAAKLERQLADDPANAEKWLLLARTAAELRQWQKSANAYRQVMTLAGGGAEFAAAYGEMLVMAADGVVTPTARQAFVTALVHDPADVPARFYMALSAAQAGEAESAIAQWQRLAADLPGGDIRAELQRRIEETTRSAGLPAPALAAPTAPALAREAARSGTAAAGPELSAADMANAAQLSGDDRQAMIRAMVERLAARLEAEPDDLDGWQRLARAYEVLGEGDHAANAYRHVEQLKAR